MAAEAVARGLAPARSGHCRRGPAGASLDSVLVSSRRGSRAQRMQVDRPSLGPAPLPQEEMGSVPPEGVRALGAAIAAGLHPHPRPLWPWARPGAAARSDAQAPPPQRRGPPAHGFPARADASPSRWMTAAATRAHCAAPRRVGVTGMTAAPPHRPIACAPTDRGAVG